MQRRPRLLDGLRESARNCSLNSNLLRPELVRHPASARLHHNDFECRHTCPAWLMPTNAPFLIY